jgi:hypothetical protein
MDLWCKWEIAQHKEYWTEGSTKQNSNQILQLPNVSISVSYQGTSTQALEKTEEAIKNGQSRETGNIV